jgi:hypothetical protein
MRIWLLFLLSLASALADEISTLCADRTAVERVYYNHRLGNKPPFEQSMPPALVQNLVRADLRKEAVLKNAYHVEVSCAMVDAEVRRINSTTRAPDVLAELKAALDNDALRFARAVARPIVVEATLREKFENDDALHATQRREVENVRGLLVAGRNRGESVTNLSALLKQAHGNEVSEITWQLGARPPETNAPDTDLIEAQKRFGPNARILSPSPDRKRERAFYFEELPAALQNVLRVQLRQPGDVSAVVEMPGGFALYLATEKTTAFLTVTALSIPKRSYEQWIEEQNQTTP